MKVLITMITTTTTNMMVKMIMITEMSDMRKSQTLSSDTQVRTSAANHRKKSSLHNIKSSHRHHAVTAFAAAEVAAAVEGEEVMEVTLLCILRSSCHSYDRVFPDSVEDVVVVVGCLNNLFLVSSWFTQERFTQRSIGRSPTVQPPSTFSMPLCACLRGVGSIRRGRISVPRRILCRSFPLLA